ncbi:NACHT, LRR and PYD domains-containing protein 12-like isoform X7 [Bufo bufo]|uniref:NACHT, LRR and PYD domains-containing protein 12-like isoform X7 n=1 Tax=Bufo bufo TaxID=8384 RepID=UPI001ABED55C|nr:NACHT, LRR and PYD domains-containing protein 12-like isoform X7 [Bufo bufo]
MFQQKLRQFEDHALRMIYKYFQDDLLYIVENLNLYSLLDQLNLQNIPEVTKYKDLEKDVARILLDDIFKLGREAVIGLWVSLYVLRKEHQLPSLEAVLEELCHKGETLVEQVLLDKEGHELPPALKDAQKHHKKNLYEKKNKLVEHNPPRCNQGEQSFSFCTRYVNLIIVSTQRFRRHSENELIETGVKHEEYLKKTQNELQHIFPNKLFRWCHRSKQVPRMVMVSGVPGVGKTTLMQKVVYDWVTGDLYQRFSFVFFFKFRELNRLDKVSLEALILHQYPYLWEQLSNILQEPEKLLFIFDGLDESLHNMDFTSRHLCPNPKQPELCGQIVVSLLRKSLLDGCSVLMTSRPTRLASIDCSVFQRIVEITGFFPEERWMYFENFFPDPKLAEKAFNYVKQNDTLYTFCYIPSYCWIICTVLSKSFQPTSSDQPASLLPKTVTQLFAIFVANILSNHSLHKSDAQKILQSMGWMAEHGVMNHRIIFDERDLDCFHVDNKSKLLSSFLMESEEPVSYSFLHLTVQEFFSALVHYVDYSPEKLQKSLKDAKSYPDGRGEMFLHFLCGLSDGSTRSILTGYLDKQAAQASRDVITWLNHFILEEQRTIESEDKKRHLLSTFFYLYESRNKALVLESLKSDGSLDFSYVRMSALDCTVLAFILDTCKNIEELDLTGCFLQTEGLERLVPGLNTLKYLSLADNNLPDTSCIQLASGIRNNQYLKILDLSRNRLSGPHFSDLMEALSSPACRIEELYLDKAGLPNTSCIKLAIGIRNQSLKKLDLSNNYLSGPHFSDLMEALSSPACRIETLRLGANGLPDTSCIQLASGIRNNPSLKILDLSVNRLSGPHFSDLMEALSSPACRIEELHLANNDLRDTSCIQLASVIRNNPSLKILALSGNRLSGPHFSDLMEALSSPACRIEELRLGRNDLPDTSCIQLASVIRNNQSLKILVLSNNYLSGPHFSDLMEALSSPACRIETLRLGYNHLPDTSCIQLASVIRNNRSLKKLDLSGNRLSGPHFSDLMEALSSPACRIEELDLGNNGLPDTSCIQLAFVIRNNKSLKKLVLYNNRLSGPHFSDLMEALSSPACRIEELHLGDNELPDTSSIQLASVIRNNQSLKKLVLFSNRLSGPHFRYLMEALSSPACRIEELDLRKNGLPDTSCIQLASVIRNNQSLKILDLSDNRLSGPHFSDLMEALSSPACRIEELRLGNNHLPDTYCIQLASGIRNNPSLKILDLSSNRLFGPHFRYLMEALSSPACRIEKLYLGDNELPDTSSIQLASVIRNNRSLKILDLSVNRLSGPHFSHLMEALSSPACRIEELDLKDNELSEEEKEAIRKLKKQKPDMKIILFATDEDMMM